MSDTSVNILIEVTCESKYDAMEIWKSVCAALEENNLTEDDASITFQSVEA